MAPRRRRAQAEPPPVRAAVAPIPQAALSRIKRAAPSARSVVIGIGLLAAAIGGYAVLRTSSAFAVRHIEVRGASPAVAAEVRRSLAPLRGHSLLGLDGGALVRRVDDLSTVEWATYDRAFPHTLRLTVAPELPVAVLHRGTETWLLSRRGRVIARIPVGTHTGLARIWVPRRAPVAVGAVVSSDDALVVARALALTGPLPVRIATAALAHGQLTLQLRSGLELRLGEPTDVRLKLAIVRRALRQLPAGSTYLDVSLPGRPVAGSDNPQVSSGG